jgi:CxxC-x17-CxxC domain-containing protein
LAIRGLPNSVILTFVRDFNRRDSGRSGGGRDFGRRDFGRPQEMHDAICSNCGKACQVPFRPTGEKPVYCRECFAKMRPEGERRNDNFERRDNRGDRDNDRRSGGQNGPNYNEQFTALNAKLDKILNLLAVKEITPKATKTQAPVAEVIEEIAEPVVVKKKRVSKKAPKAEL